MIDEIRARILAEKFFSYCYARFVCTIDLIIDPGTFWKVGYSLVSKTDPSAMHITGCWLMIDKETGLIYTPRVRTQGSDVRDFPGNRDELPCTDLTRE